MIGMVLVTHGRLAEELRSAMEHVVGKQRNVDTVCIGPEDDVDNRRAEIEACITRCDTGDGVVLLTDRKSTRLNSSHRSLSRMPSSA